VKWEYIVVMDMRSLKLLKSLFRNYSEVNLSSRTNECIGDPGCPIAERLSQYSQPEETNGSVEGKLMKLWRLDVNQQSNYLGCVVG